MLRSQGLSIFILKSQEKINARVIENQSIILFVSTSCNHT